MARKSKFNPKYHIPWIAGLAARGYTIEDMAEDIGVAQSTLHKWISENEELSEALKNGRSLPDTIVENSLYKRATGYKITKRKTIISSAANGEQKPVRVEVSEEEIAPDVTAAIFWLKNRRPDLWRDRQDVTINSEDWVDALTDAVKEYDKDAVAGTKEGAD
ncbi:MAG: helix-turn-helix domain-containing protein [Bacteroidales bacterium]|nr:helix-turn-helix domain-containing protein [Bacteroidales bacterium]